MNKRRHKYRARRIYADGSLKKLQVAYCFDSELEYDMACQLELKRRNGDIREWTHHPHPVILDKYTKYQPDFEVIQKDRKHVFIECKGFLTAQALKKLRIMAGLQSHFLYIAKRGVGGIELLTVQEYLEKRRDRS